MFPNGVFACGRFGRSRLGSTTPRRFDLRGIPRNEDEYHEYLTSGHRKE
jgi:hypothetical protein